MLLPLQIDIYEIVFRLIMRAINLMGAKRLKEDWLVFNDCNFQKTYVYFDRFKFDVCSLLTDEID